MPLDVVGLVVVAVVRVVSAVSDGCVAVTDVGEEVVVVPAGPVGEGISPEETDTFPSKRTSSTMTKTTAAKRRTPTAIRRLRRFRRRLCVLRVFFSGALAILFYVLSLL